MELIKSRIKEGEGYIKQNWAESTNELLEGWDDRSAEFLRGFLKLFGGESPMVVYIYLTTDDTCLFVEEAISSTNARYFAGRCNSFAFVQDVEAAIKFSITVRQLAEQLSDCEQMS